MRDNATARRLIRLIDEARVATDKEPLDEPPQPDTFLPELLDSLALATLIALIEEEWGFELEDEEIDPDIFQTLMHLAAFVEEKSRLGA